MKKIAAVLAILALNPVAYAAETQPVLDTVFFQVAAKQWVNTQTALVSVNINATLTNADLAQARTDIMGRLAKVALGEWHLVQFNRSQDSSGLEKLYVQAQARIPQSNLTHIYQNAKSVSKPGASYEIGSIEFKPGLDEVQQVRMQLRERLYQQVRDEVARINKIYPTQNYSVFDLVITEGEGAPSPQAQPRGYPANEMINSMVMPASAPALSVSNELTMTAMVYAASSRQPKTA